MAAAVIARSSPAQVPTEHYMRSARRDAEKHADALGNLANLYAEQGDRAKALKTYERALRANPKHEENRRNFAKFKKAG